LPFAAYADLDAHARGEAPTPERVAALSGLLRAAYARGALDDNPRVSTGALAALRCGATEGLLERLLTATPWTSFHGAYALRGIVSEAWYDREEAAFERLVAATLLELSRTELTYTEISISTTSTRALGKARRWARTARKVLADPAFRARL